MFRSDDLTLEGQIIIPEQPRAALLLCHGIPGGGPPDPTDEGYEGFARAMAASRFAAMWFNFRGCRGAPGEFSVSGWRTDIDGALDAMVKIPGVGELPRMIVGSSAGGAAGIDVAADRDDVAMIATLAAPATLAGVGDDEEALLQRLRNIGVIHDPNFPPDPKEWWADLVGGAAENAIGRISPRPILLIHAHAHNDYLHDRPLFDALDCGFCSIEADVHLVGDALFVGHSLVQLRPGRTLEKLYLQPLSERVRQNGATRARSTPSPTGSTAA